MELKNQVCTIEQSKRLKELGIKYDGFFTWLEAGRFDETGSKVIEWVPVLFYEHMLDLVAVEADHDEALQEEYGEFHETRGNYPAFTVAELGVMLPFYLVNYGELTIKKNYRREKQTGWNVSYEKSGDYKGVYLPKFCSETQAGAMCLMLIHLLENKLITPEQVNASLTQQ